MPINPSLSTTSSLEELCSFSINLDQVNDNWSTAILKNIVPEYMVNDQHLRCIFKKTNDFFVLNCSALELEEIKLVFCKDYFNLLGFIINDIMYLFEDVLTAIKEPNYLNKVAIPLISDYAFLGKTVKNPEFTYEGIVDALKKVQQFGLSWSQKKSPIFLIKILFQEVFRFKSAQLNFSAIVNNERPILSAEELIILSESWEKWSIQTATNGQLNPEISLYNLHRINADFIYDLDEEY